MNIIERLPHIDASGMVHVCMNCHPGYSILDTHPEWKGCKISHSICPTHSDEMTKRIFMLRSMRETRKK